MTLFSAPNAVRAPDDVLGLARSVVDGDADALASHPDADISCRPGCGACCSQAVPVLPAEVRSIVSHLDDLPPERRQQLQRRISDAAGRLAEAGLDASGLPSPSDPDRARFVARYFAANIPCPMLDDDATCAIRPVRPLACREYLVSSDPKHCATAGHEQVVRLRSRRDVIAGFHDVSDLFGENTVGLLALSLHEPAPAPEAQPRSGASVMRLMMSHYASEADGD